VSDVVSVHGRHTDHHWRCQPQPLCVSSIPGWTHACHLDNDLQPLQGWFNEEQTSSDWAGGSRSSSVTSTGWRTTSAATAGAVLLPPPGRLAGTSLIIHLSPVGGLAFRAESRPNRTLWLSGRLPQAGRRVGDSHTRLDREDGAPPPWWNHHCYQMRRVRHHRFHSCVPDRPCGSL